MAKVLSKLFKKSKTEQKREIKALTSNPEIHENLIKMKDAMQLLHASAPTIRKYARLGYYNEYRFGAKLVLYNKQEILDFILGSSKTTE